MEYTDLDVWKASRELVKSIYEATQNFPKTETYGITNQMRRSAISIPSNIAEACGRSHKKETIQFLYIVRGSLYELETQVYVAFDLFFLNEELLNKLLDQITTSKKLLHGFMKYLKNHQPTTINH